MTCFDVFPAFPRHPINCLIHFNKLQFLWLSLRVMNQYKMFLDTFMDHSQSPQPDHPVGFHEGSGGADEGLYGRFQ